jgi:hypothetical protein
LLLARRETTHLHIFFLLLFNHRLLRLGRNLLLKRLLQLLIRRLMIFVTGLRYRVPLLLLLLLLLILLLLLLKLLRKLANLVQGFDLGRLCVIQILAHLAELELQLLAPSLIPNCKIQNNQINEEKRQSAEQLTSQLLLSVGRCGFVEK